MDQFHVISLLGADARYADHNTDLAQATRDLNRKTLRLHARHAASWLLRAALVAGLFLLGRFVIEGSIGNAMAWTAGFLSLYVLWFLSKGHLLISNDRQAKLYWLQNDADNHAYCSHDPVLATMPDHEAGQPPRCAGNTAS